jgi:hypothetical protein
MSRTDTFRMRVTPIERQIITAIARQLDRNESDTVRMVLHEKAHELGVIANTNGIPSPSTAEDAARVGQPALKMTDAQPAANR